jgi:hypothetical protein
MIGDHKYLLLDVVAYIWNTSTQDAKTGGSW